MAWRQMNIRESNVSKIERAKESDVMVYSTYVCTLDPVVVIVTKNSSPLGLKGRLVGGR